MRYQKSTSTSGAWVKAKDLEGADNLVVKLVSEVQQIEGEFGKQDVGKVRIEGEEEAKNVRINKTSLNGLITAFGEESKDWIGKELRVQIENSVVSRRRVKVLYLVPQDHELSEDENGYLVIKKIEDILVVE